MSRFIDKLNQVLQGAQPIGFRPAPSVSGKPRIQLVASLAQVDVDNLAGADAGLLRLADSKSVDKALERMSQIAADIPWGGWLDGVDDEGAKRLVEAGADFVVFPAATSLAVFQDDEVGKVLQVEASLGEGLLAVINDLPVDAVLIAGEQEAGYSLSWHHLMAFQRFAGSLTKPLLVSIPQKVTAGELRAMWEAGVSGVVVEPGGKQAGEILSALRRQIDELTVTPRRSKVKGRALLPQVAREASIAEEEEE